MNPDALGESEYPCPSCGEGFKMRSPTQKYCCQRCCAWANKHAGMREMPKRIKAAWEYERRPEPEAERAKRSKERREVALTARLLAQSDLDAELKKWPSNEFDKWKYRSVQHWSYNETSYSRR